MARQKKSVRTAAGPRFRLNGSRERVWFVRVEGFPFKTFGTGQRAYQDALRYYTDCKTNAKGTGPDPAKVTIADLAQAAEPKNLRNLRNDKDRQTRRTRIELLIDRYGHRLITTIVKADIYDLQDWLTTKKYAASTTNEYCGLFKRIMDRGVDEGLLTSNPLNNYDRLKKKDSRETRYPLTEAQWAEFFQFLEDGWFKDAVLAYLHTGCRKMELARLEWENIHLDTSEGDYMVVRNHQDDESGQHFRPKSKAGFRLVPITPDVRAILDKNKGKRAKYPFPGPKARMSANTILNNFKKAILRFNKRPDANLIITPKTRIHDLRHTFGTWAARKLPLPTLKVLMGHHAIAETAKYCAQDSTTALKDFHHLNPFSGIARHDRTPSADA